MKKDTNVQMGLLDLLGIQEEEPEKPEESKEVKAESKANVAASKPADSSKKKKKVKKYKCPIAIHGGPYSYTINEDQEMSTTEVKNHILKTFPELKGILNVNMQKDSTCMLEITFKETKLSKIKDQGIFIVKLGKEYVISNIGVEDAVMAWNQKFPQYVGCKFHYVDGNEHILIPFYDHGTTVLRSYRLPVNVGFPGMIESIDFADLESKETASGAEIIEEYSVDHPEFKDCDFKYDESSNTIIPLFFKAMYDNKNCMMQLPIEVATGGYHIKFTADDFSGKDIVTMEEIREELERMFPEYSRERTIMTYDKHHFVIAILKSSTKGATIIASRNGFHREVAENGSVTEYRPYGKFELTGDDQLHFSLNSDSLKIPQKLLFDIIDRFSLDINKECALQLFMTKDEKGYWLYEPKQKASVHDVVFERNHQLEEEYVLVMDIHSHGTLQTFFSGTDNRDEKGIRLYMVVGDFSEKNPHSCNIKIRAGMNGVFEDLSLEDIFVK